jgi:uncharacterized repeat protein (TIGR01451 family)
MSYDVVVDDSIEITETVPVTLANTITATLNGYVETETSVVTLTLQQETTVTVAKVDDRDPVGPGDSLIYTISIENTGEITATSIQVTENYPDGFEFSWAEPTPTTLPNIWEVAALPPGETYAIAAGGQVGLGVVPGTVLTNQVSVTGTEFLDVMTSEETLVVFVIPGDTRKHLPP